MSCVTARFIFDVRLLGQWEKKQQKSLIEIEVH